MISPTRPAASAHDVGCASNLVPLRVAMKNRSSAARSATRVAVKNIADRSSFVAPRAPEMLAMTSAADLLIAVAISSSTWFGGRRSAPLMRTGSRPTVAVATASAPQPSASSCAESAVTIVAFVASLRSATSATRRTASAWHALTAVAMPGGGCGSRITPVGRVASSDGATPINHMPMCAPEGVTPTAASFAVSSATSAICSEVSAASASRSAANTPPASG